VITGNKVAKKVFSDHSIRNMNFRVSIWRRKWIETESKIILLSEILQVPSKTERFNPHSSQKELFLLPSVADSLPLGQYAGL